MVFPDHTHLLFSRFYCIEYINVKQDHGITIQYINVNQGHDIKIEYLNVNQDHDILLDRITHR